MNEKKCEFETLIYRLRAAGKAQQCAKNLMLSDFEPTVQLAIERNNLAVAEAGEVRDALWELYAGDMTPTEHDADLYEMMLQVIWGIDTKIRDTERSITDNIDNPVLTKYLREKRKEYRNLIDSKIQELLAFLESKQTVSEILKFFK